MMPQDYMQAALVLATTGLGRTWPNPSVGCVIVKDGKIIAQARTANGGRPHAESLALDEAGDAAASATVYVTLEPCAHHGKTPPCADALVKAKVAEVVIGVKDPDPRTSGNGIKILQDAGIKVTLGILERQCREANKGFFKLAEKGLPYVMLKAAISGDGKFLRATTAGINWVTGKKAREEVHALRAQYDAIMTGTGTVLADNPQLNVRLPGMDNHSPIRVVIGQSKIPPSAKIYASGETWAYSSLENTLPDLAKRGITRLMVEAGPKLSNAMLAENLVDEIIIFQSQRQLGKQGEDFFAAGFLQNYKKISEEKFAEDLKLTYLKI